MNAYDPSEVIYCPQCENACSEKAAACPRCGHPFVARPAALAMPYMIQALPQPIRRSPLRTAFRWFLFGLMAFFLIYVGMCTYLAGSKMNQIFSASNPTPRSTGANAPSPPRRVPDKRLTVVTATPTRSGLLIDVKNDTATAIRAVRIYIEITSTGRDVPWLSGIFDVEVNGGLEPGESRIGVWGPDVIAGWSAVPHSRDDLEVRTRIESLHDRNLKSITREES